MQTHPVIISDLMSFDPRDLIYILLGGMIGAGLALLFIVILYFFSDYRKHRAYRDRIFKRLETADMMGQENMTQDALSIYNELLLNIPKELEPDLYARIKKSEGDCFYSTAFCAQQT